jgi:hypothetical protein
LVRGVLFPGAVVSCALVAHSTWRTLRLGNAAGRLPPTLFIGTLATFALCMGVQCALLLWFASSRASPARPADRRVASVLGAAVIASLVAFAVVGWRVGVVG